MAIIYAKFDEAAGSTSFLDQVSGGFFVENPFNDDPVLAGILGARGKAITMGDGGSNRSLIGDGTINAISDVSGFIANAWFRIPSANYPPGDYKIIFRKAQSPGDSLDSWSCYVDSGGFVNFRLRTVDGNNWHLVSNNPIAPDQWHMVMMAYDDNGNAPFFGMTDSERQVFNTHDTSGAKYTAPNGELEIGNNQPDGGPDTLPGDLDEFMLDFAPGGDIVSNGANEMDRVSMHASPFATVPAQPGCRIDAVADLFNQARTWVLAGSTVQLLANPNKQNVNDGDPLDYEQSGYVWSQFGGSGVTLTPDGVSENPTFTAGAAGDNTLLTLIPISSRGAIGYNQVVEIDPVDPPVAGAAVDHQFPNTGQLVTLDGTSSVFHAPPGSGTYLWEQIAGPGVALSDATVSQPTFTAPAALTPTVMTFKLTITDSKGFKDSTAVDVTLAAGLPAPLPPTIHDFDPANLTAIKGTSTLTFKATGPLGLARCHVAVEFPNLGIYEVIHDGDQFNADNYPVALGNVRATITGGFQFTVLRKQGWPASPRLIVTAFDPYGQFNDISGTVYAWTLVP